MKGILKDAINIFLIGIMASVTAQVVLLGVLLAVAPLALLVYVALCLIGWPV